MATDTVKQTKLWDELTNRYSLELETKDLSIVVEVCNEVEDLLNEIVTLFPCRFVWIENGFVSYLTAWIYKILHTGYRAMIPKGIFTHPHRANNNSPLL